MTHLIDWQIPYVSGLPGDVAVNTFHFNWLGVGSPASTDFDNLGIDLSAFYGACFPVAGPVFLAGILRPGSTLMKAYDLADPTPRAPRYQHTFNVPAFTDPAYTTPNEVSICLSYQGAKLSGVAQASRRGRIYFGPLGDLIPAGGTTTVPPMVNTTFITNACNAAHNLTVATVGHSWEWVVYSRKLGTATPITDGWVDNSFDTQRRRGIPSTTRSTWTAFLP